MNANYRFGFVKTKTQDETLPRIHLQICRVSDPGIDVSVNCESESQ